MAYDRRDLRKIYDKTSGYCHICHQKMYFTNYASYGERGAWEVDHSRARANNGSSHENNLYGAHIDCNRSKGKASSKSARSKYGNSRAPYSKKKKNRIRNNNTSVGVILGGSIGTAVAGPVGGVIGAFIGGAIGNNSSPKK